MLAYDRARVKISNRVFACKIVSATLLCYAHALLPYLHPYKPTTKKTCRKRASR